MNSAHQTVELPATLFNPNWQSVPCPPIMTEEELIRFLRIPEISSATDYHHVIENLKRKHGLPRIHLCGKTLYLTDSVKAWLRQRVTCGQ